MVVRVGGEGTSRSTFPYLVVYYYGCPSCPRASSTVSLADLDFTRYSSSMDLLPVSRRTGPRYKLERDLSDKACFTTS